MEIGKRIRRRLLVVCVRGLIKVCSLRRLPAPPHSLPSLRSLFGWRVNTKKMNHSWITKLQEIHVFIARVSRSTRTSTILATRNDRNAAEKYYYCSKILRNRNKLGIVKRMVPHLSYESESQAYACKMCKNENALLTQLEASWYHLLHKPANHHVKGHPAI